MKTSKRIKQRIEDAGGRYWAGDNISKYIKEGELTELIDELTVKFEKDWANMNDFIPAYFQALQNIGVKYLKIQSFY
jgi:hypothetical protein